jgi:hypothetical protein
MLGWLIGMVGMLIAAERYAKISVDTEVRKR